MSQSKNQLFQTIKSVKSLLTSHQTVKCQNSVHMLQIKALLHDDSGEYTKNLAIQPQTVQNSASGDAPQSLEGPSSK